MRLIVLSVLSSLALLFSNVAPAAACDDDDDDGDLDEQDDQDQAIDDVLDARFAGFGARMDALNARINSFALDDDDDDCDACDDDQDADADADEDDDDDDAPQGAFDFGLELDVELF